MLCIKELDQICMDEFGILFKDALDNKLINSINLTLLKDNLTRMITDLNLEIDYGYYKKSYDSKFLKNSIRKIHGLKFNISGSDIWNTVDYKLYEVIIKHPIPITLNKECLHKHNLKRLYNIKKKC